MTLRDFLETHLDKEPRSNAIRAIVRLACDQYPWCSRDDSSNITTLPVKWSSDIELGRIRIERLTAYDCEPEPDDENHNGWSGPPVLDPKDLVLDLVVSDFRPGSTKGHSYQGPKPQFIEPMFITPKTEPWFYYEPLKPRT